MTSTTDPSAPIKGLANTQHDALTSDDMLRGVGAREAEGTTLAPSSAQQVEGTGEAFVNAARDLVGGARERTADLTSSGGVGAWSSEATPPRPEKSRARDSVGQSLSDNASAAANTVSATASDAYARAPDLGISSTARAAYVRAPDLGVTSTVQAEYDSVPESSSRDRLRQTRAFDAEEKPALGVGAGVGAAGGAAAYAADENLTSAQGDNATATDAERVRQEQSRSPWSEPSDPSRVGRPQQEIGTEDGIPTRAGAATTLSPDKDVVKAQRGGERKMANVPPDFEDQPCPTACASDKYKHIAEARNPSTRTLADEGGVIRDQDQDQDQSQRGFSSVGAGVDAGAGGATGAGAGAVFIDNDARISSTSGRSQTTTTSAHTLQEVEERDRELAKEHEVESAREHKHSRSFGEKFKDGIKGEVKILAGTVTNNDEKVLQGLALKHGENPSDVYVPPKHQTLNADCASGSGRI